MALGFTAEALATPARGSGALRMGLSRLGEGEWLWPAFDADARARVFAENPESIVILPGAETAAAEAAALVSGERHDTLADAAAAGWEDLCVLQADDSGQYQLTAAAVGFPTDWDLGAKMGRGLTVIHAPIHGYAEQLASGVDHFFVNLPVGPIFGRSNWFVAPTDAWRYLPQDDPALRFAHVDAENAGETLFLRCERQTLRRLPGSGAVLFTIGIAISPFHALSTGLVARIADNLAALRSGEHERRAAPHYTGALAHYAARRMDLEISA